MTANHEDAAKGKGDTVRRVWTNCPLCREPDMECESDAEGNKVFRCTNISCISNGNTRAAPPEQAPEVAEAIAWAKVAYPDSECVKTLIQAASHPTVPPSGDKKKALEALEKHPWGSGFVPGGLEIARINTTIKSALSSRPAVDARVWGLLELIRHEPSDTEQTVATVQEIKALLGGNTGDKP